VDAICKSYRVYHNKPGAEYGEKEGDDYLVDHSIILYLMDRNGDFLQFFGQTKSSAQITEAIEQFLKDEKQTTTPGLFDRIFGGK
jgi:protein SCO1/2